MKAVPWLQNSRKVDVGSDAAVVESDVIARRMIVFAFEVKRDQLGSFISFDLDSSVYCCWNKSAIFAMVKVNCGSVENVPVGGTIDGGGVAKDPGSWAGWMVRRCC